MNSNYSFPRRQQAPVQPSDSTTEFNASPADDLRKSNALRASVLDAALQLGFGSDSKVAKWMFNEGGEDEDEDLNSPGLTSSASTAPSTGTSDDAYLYPRTISPPSFARDASYSPFPPPIFPVKATHLRRPSSEPFAHVTGSELSHEMEAAFGKQSPKGRNKLVKKRSDGHISDGGYLSESAPRNKIGKDLSKAEKKELERVMAQKEKEEKKQKKAAKKAEKDSGFTTGYETEAADATPVKKNKKKTKVRLASDGGYETDEGNQSSTSSKKSKSKFFRLGNRSKGDIEREPEPEIPPVPELPPIHPIADKFSTSFSLESSFDGRSFTPTSVSSLHSNQSSFVSSVDSARTVHAAPNDSTTTLSTLDTVSPRPSAEPSFSSEITVSLRPESPYQVVTPRVSNEEPPEVTAPDSRSPPTLVIPPSSYEPFIKRSPQNSPLRTIGVKPSIPSRPVGLPASPRPTDAAQIPTGSCRSPVPPSPRSFDSISNRARLPTPVSPLRSEYLQPGSEPNGRASPSQFSQFSVHASSEYLVPSPLPSPRGPSQYGMPPPTPPPTAPLPAPPLEQRGRMSPFAQRPPHASVSAGLEARVRSQRYNRNIYTMPKRAVRSEDGHGPPPSASRSLERGRRHQSANDATTTTPIVSSPEPDCDVESAYPSPVEGMHDILARYQHPEMERETGQALARNQSIKHLAHFRMTSDDDDASHYSDDEAGGEWRQSILDNDKSQDAHDRLLEQITTSYDDSGRVITPNPASSFTHRPYGVPAGAAKPGWI